jgi:hypothetical protein
MPRCLLNARVSQQFGSPKRPPLSLSEEFYKGFLPSIKRKKDRGWRYDATAVHHWSAVNAVVGCVGAFLSSQVFD